MGKIKKVASTLAEKKTEERLSALAGVVSGSFEDLAEAYITSAEISICRFHFHMPPMSVDLGKLDFMKGLTVDEAKYVRDNGGTLKFFCFPKEAKRIKSICESIRRYLKSLTVGNSDYISSDDFYGKFLPYLSEKERELEEVKISIGIYYETELKNFRDNVFGVVSSVCPERADIARAEVSYITGRTKESFLDNISFDLETEFSGEGTEEDMTELLRRAKQAYIMREIESIYVGQLQQLWGILGHYVTVIKSAPEALSGYQLTRQTLREAAEKVERMNVGGIPVITDIVSRIIDLSKEEARDLANVTSFELMAEIFGRGSEFGASFRFSEDLPKWVQVDDLLEAYRR